MGKRRVKITMTATNIRATSRNVIRELPMEPDSLFALSGETKGAEYSPDEVFRYALWRYWNWTDYNRVCTFIGLNPSTATEKKDDPTVRRCTSFAKQWGFDGLYMLNLYAFRATDPRVMKAADDPIGDANDEAIARFANRSGMVVCAWGKHAEPERAAEVLKLLTVPTFCLKLNNDGSPRHPLYVADGTAPILYKPEFPECPETTSKKSKRR